MAINLDLKLAILASGLTQRQIAERTAIPQSTLSLIVRGHRPATKDERIKISMVLNRPQRELWPDLQRTA